ncbi:ymaf [Lucifera butyrica]|uniref:Ymaf n=1 Tax=Lucifera butyrica TaxID=1351585 RepID=A0A498REU3_9FIRM|nr:YmaF family protein [Lucifera butyrica]VBB09839.1 ymaf [Lucifera butyrica]
MDDKDERKADRDCIHVHLYQTEVEPADPCYCHQHVLAGVSLPAYRKDSSHVHCLKGRTTFFVDADGQHGHWHWYEVVTDCAVDLNDGWHVHYYCGKTSVNDGHCHIFQGSVCLAPDLLLGKDFAGDDDDPDDDDYVEPKTKKKHKRDDQDEVE